MILNKDFHCYKFVLFIIIVYIKLGLFTCTIFINYKITDDLFFSQTKITLSKVNISFFTFTFFKKND